MRYERHDLWSVDENAKPRAGIIWSDGKKVIVGDPVYLRTAYGGAGKGTLEKKLGREPEYVPLDAIVESEE
jgi:hypothetical protein